MSKKTERFYMKALTMLKKSEIPFLIGGTFAFTEYTGINRPTHDLDIFCKAGDYPRILKIFESEGYLSEITDERWIAKVFDPRIDKKKPEREDSFIDLIFGSKNGVQHVDDSWLEKAQPANIFGVDVQIVAPEEIFWSKAYRQDRFKYDGADVYHIILKKGEEMDWKVILNRMEQNWEVLLSHLITYRFIYPADRDMVPKWLMEELLSRLQNQMDLPPPIDRVCRGRLLSHTQYEHAIQDWGYKDFS